MIDAAFAASILTSRPRIPAPAVIVFCACALAGVAAGRSAAAEHLSLIHI